MMKVLYYWPVYILALLISSSCTKEDENNTKAVFSYVADGFMVNFTNFSSNASSYEWDFGDGNSSTQRSPQHIYSSRGDFLVTLKALSNGIESSFTDTVVILGPNIKIDGNFSDWEHVPYTHVNEEGGTISAIKTFASSDFLFFYLEGNQQFNLSVLSMYIDADNNPETGFKTWMYPVSSGADFMLEGNFNQADPLASAGTIYRHIDPNNGWGWDYATSFGEGTLFSQMRTAGGMKSIEFGIRRSFLGTMRNFVNFAIIEMDGSWTPIGSMPASALSTSEFLPLQL